MKKITLPVRKMQNPVELAPECVLCNEVVLPWESRHRIDLYVIGNEYGPLCALWARHEQDALDEMVDSDLGNSFLVDEDSFKAMSEEERDGLAYLGNASEPADLEHCWIHTVNLEDLEPRLLCMFAECRGAGAKSLDYL